MRREVKGHVSAVDVCVCVCFGMLVFAGLVGMVSGCLVRGERREGGGEADAAGKFSYVQVDAASG